MELVHEPLLKIQDIFITFLKAYKRDILNNWRIPLGLFQETRWTYQVQRQCYGSISQVDQKSNTEHTLRRSMNTIQEKNSLRNYLQILVFAP
jgi:hypothetical protein